MKEKCGITIDGCPGADDPVLNLSAEDPDPLLFTGIGFTNYHPFSPPQLLRNGQYVAQSCLGLAFSDQSQQAADSLARQQAALCQSAHGPILDPPLGPGVPGGPGSYNSGGAPGPNGGPSGGPGHSGSGGGGGGGGSGPIGTPIQRGGSIPVGPCTIASKTCNVQVYDQVCQHTYPGLHTPYAYSGGGLPPGIVLSDAAPAFTNAFSLFGTPTVGGDYTMVINITDPKGKTVQNQYPLHVLGLTKQAIEDPNIPSGYIVPLDDATCQTPYHYQLAAAGGQAPITFSAEGAPGWLTISSGGMISGTPADADVGNNVQFDVVMTDAAGRSCKQTVNILVKCGVEQPPDGMLCTQYAPYQLRMCPNTTVAGTFSGTAPGGMAIDANGILSGKPTVQGLNSFSVSATLANGQTCIATGQINIAPDGSGRVSAIKDAVWTTTNLGGDFTSTMAGATGTLRGRASMGPGWPAIPACAVLSTAGGYSQVPIKNCSGADYTMTVQVNWTLDAPACTLDNNNPPTTVYGSGWLKIWINPGAGPPNEHITYVYMGPAYGAGFSGTGGTSFNVPDVNGVNILLQLFDFGGRELTANVVLSPAVPP